MVEMKNIVPENVVNLYDLTGITPLAGIQDYTDGIYNGNPSIPHDVAQKKQHEYLLDEIGAREGFRLLEVGCGLGTLLETARERGVRGVGITISEDQVSQCRDKGLDVRLHNYKDLPEEFTHSLDGVIANGSLEHFSQPEDAIAGKQDKIYQTMFEIFARVLDPESESQRVATTAIHFNGNPINPRKFIKNPLLQVFDSEGFHASILHQSYGGFYPVENQLKRCASQYFRMLKEVNGTDDYRITSEHWCKEYGRALFTNPKFMLAIGKHFLKRPIHTVLTAASYVGPESWAWQFRGDNPPAKLYRHTWERIKE